MLLDAGLLNDQLAVLSMKLPVDNLEVHLLTGEIPRWRKKLLKHWATTHEIEFDIETSFDDYTLRGKPLIIHHDF